MISQRILIFTVLFIIPILGVSQTKTQTITFNALQSKTFGDASFSITAKASSGLPITLSSSNKLVTTIADSIVTIVGAGSTIITASQSGDNVYSPAISVSQTLVVEKANQVITFPDFSSITFGDGPHATGSFSSSGLPLTYALSNPLIGYLVSGAFVSTAGGQSTVTASQVGNNNYKAASPVSKVVFVDRASQAISFPAFPVKTFGDPSFSPGASASSSSSIVYQTSDPTMAIIQNGQVVILGAGTVDIAANQSGNNNFQPAKTVVRTLTIKKANQYLAISSPSSATYGDAPFTLTAASSTGLPVTFTTQYDSVVSTNGATATIQGAGTTVITARVPGNANYLPAQVTQTFVVNKASQSITFSSIPTQTLGGAPFLLTATASSGLPVTYTSSRRSVATTSGNTLLTQAFGTTSIVASQAGNANYLPAQNVTQNLTISGTASVFPMIGSTQAGNNGKGKIITLNSDGTNLNTAFNFPTSGIHWPDGGLLKGSDGKLYGLVSGGGNPGYGVVFSINTDGSSFTVLHNFSLTDGFYPTGNLIEATDGYLYGTTMWGGLNVGVVFRIKKDGTNFSTIYKFTSAYYPVGGLLQAADGKLYGVAAQGGTLAYGVVFTLNLDGTGYNEILSFDGASRGSYPHGALIQGGDLFLYGVTASGGNSGKGVLFKVSTDGTSFTKLVDFDGTAKGANGTSTLLSGSDGKLYGITQRGGTSDNGIIFGVATNGTGFVKIYDFDGTSGSNALGSLSEGSDGYLYGMTNLGGTANLGTAFKIKKDGSNFTKLTDFQGTNGANPQLGQLLEVQNGLFFGMTNLGGTANAGIIFSVSSTGTFNQVKDFPQQPNSPEGLVSDDAFAHLFGIAAGGGASGSGAIFRTNGDGSNYTNIADLPGSVYYSGLTHTRDGSLWAVGTTVISNTSFSYSLYKASDDGSNFHQVTTMNDLVMGTNPFSLVDMSANYLYGVCQIGGSANGGTIFKIKKDGTQLTKVADFPGGALGRAPYSKAIRHSNGSLYGVADEGGKYNSGVVYKVDTTGVYSKIADLNQPVTGTSAAAIIELNGGSLGVTTRGGGANNGGTLFIVSENGGSPETIVSFSTPTGTQPICMTQSVEGYIYVSLGYGSTHGQGSLIRVLPDGTGFLKILDADTLGSSVNTILFQKQSQSITPFDDIPQKQFTDLPFLLNASSSSGSRIMFSSSDPTIASIDGYQVTIHKIGTVTISAQAPANGNYTASSVLKKTLTILPANQQLTFAEITPKSFVDPGFKLGASTTSGLPISFSSSNPAVATVSNGRVTIVADGATTITATVASSVNFNAVAAQQRQLTVNKSGQTIEFDPLGTHYVVGSPFTASVSTTSGLATSLANATPSVATAEGNLITLRSEGQDIITASASGNGNFVDATPVPVTLTVVKLNQTITFDQLQDQPAEVKSFRIQKPASTSGLPVDLSYTSSHISILNNNVTVNGPGSVTINADQKGDSVFLTAARVSRSFCIIPSKPLLTVDYGDSVHVKLTSSAAQGNEWFNNGSLITGESGQTLTTTQSGSYTVRVTIEGCSGAPSDPQILSITGLEDQQHLVSAYPNPVRDQLFISLPVAGTADIRLFDLTGRELQKIESSSTTTEIDVHQIVAGVYFVRIQLDSVLSVIKFVKM